MLLHLCKEGFKCAQYIRIVLHRPNARYFLLIFKKNLKASTKYSTAPQHGISDNPVRNLPRYCTWTDIAKSMGAFFHLVTANARKIQNGRKESRGFLKFEMKSSSYFELRTNVIKNKIVRLTVCNLIGLSFVITNSIKCPTGLHQNGCIMQTAASSFTGTPSIAHHDIQIIFKNDQY